MLKPPVETVRVSRQGKDQLSKLVRHTGIKNWNVLCRWAYCASLSDPKLPTPFNGRLDGGVEMTWKVFSGDFSDIYAGLAAQRALQEGCWNSEEDVAQNFRAHLHRGISYLSAGTATKSIEDFLVRWADRAR